MVFLAIYLLSVATLASYRKSRYWPQHVEGFGYLSSGWIQWGSLLAALVLFIWQHGWLMGCLLMLLAYLTIVSLLIFFANCTQKTVLLAVVIFHVILMLCFIFSI
ncbi:MAG: hypothetical protein LBF27_28935 [Sphingobacterium sp.]|jgi:hypothetical protein|nr:hypothetical protein [Sphingobacterium sp.]